MSYARGECAKGSNFGTLETKSEHSLSSDSGDEQREKVSKHTSASSPRSATSRNSQSEDMDQDSPDNKNNLNSKKLSSSKRPRKIKPYRWVKRIVRRENYDPNNKDEKFLLRVSNFPTEWGLDEVKNIVFEEYGPVDVIYMAVDKEMTSMGIIQLEFTSYTECRKALQALHGIFVNDVKLFAEILDSDAEESDDDIPSQPKRKKSSNNPWRPDIDIWNIDPEGLYGFKPEYLQSLGIKPPVDRWVNVTNFRCDKAELREVLELAGQVIQVNIDSRGAKIANVMYSHPLEAVQAVSMLNNRQFYGQNLKISITNCPVGTTFLPKGLQNIGPGLGSHGKPLRDIVKQYERYVTYKSSFVDSTIFRNPEVLLGSIAEESEVYDPQKINTFDNSNDSENKMFCNRKIVDQSVIFNTNEFNANGSNAGFRGTSFSNTGPNNISCSLTSMGPMRGPIPGPIGPCGPVSGPVGPMGPMAGPMGPMPGPMGPMPGSMGPMTGPMGPNNAMCKPMGPGNPMGPISGPVNVQGPRGPGPMPPFGPAGPIAPGPRMGSGPGLIAASPSGKTTTVELVNLPLSTTFALLSEKMAACGQVTSLQLTSPGCAVVQFALPDQADRCYRMYNKCSVMGNVIQVKFL